LQQGLQAAVRPCQTKATGKAEAEEEEEDAEEQAREKGKGEGEEDTELENSEVPFWLLMEASPLAARRTPKFRCRTQVL